MVRFLKGNHSLQENWLNYVRLVCAWQLRLQSEIYQYCHLTIVLYAFACAFFIHQHRAFDMVFLMAREIAEICMIMEWESHSEIEYSICISRTAYKQSLSIAARFRGQVSFLLIGISQLLHIPYYLRYHANHAKQKQKPIVYLHRLKYRLFFFYRIIPS